MFELIIRTDNEAFANDPLAEIARILRSVAKDVENYGAPERGVFDRNGNRVGSYVLND